jgi:hypothetical protein
MGFHQILKVKQHPSPPLGVHGRPFGQSRLGGGHSIVQLTCGGEGDMSGYLAQTGVKNVAGSSGRALDRLPIDEVLVGFTHSLSPVTYLFIN